MKIGYDISILEENRFTGVEKLAFFLFREMWYQGNNDEHYLFCRKTPKIISQEIADHLHVIEVGYYKFWRWRKLPPLLKKHQVDVFLSPVSALPGLTATSLIAYVHECQWRHTSWEETNWKHRAALWLAALRSRCLLTNSHYTKKEVQKELSFFCPDIHVISPAGTPLSVTSSQKNAQEPYCLFVSTIRPKKNIQLLIETFSREDMRNTRLVCAGKILHPEFVKQAKKQGASNIDFLGYVNDDKLAQLYQNATAFLYVSQHEGFGLPLLEAFAQECPVIASQKGSIPEVARNAACYVETLTSEELANKIQMVCKNPSEQQRLIMEGKKRLEEYSWKKSAEKLLKIISNEFK